MQSIAYIPASNGSANASLMTVQTARAVNATTILVNTVANAPTKFYGTMGTPHTFTDPVTSEVITVISDATAVDFAGSISGSSVNIDAIAPGYTDLGSKVGDIIIIRPVTEWSNNLKNILAAEHLDNGKHGDITVNSILTNSNQDLSNNDLYNNAIINAGCLVAQRAAPTLSTTYQYGQVDRFAVKATGTAVTAGTITQNSGSNVAATKGKDLKVAGLTVTGTGILFLRYRMEAKDAQMFVNAKASFGVKVYHDIGSSVNATIYVNKANAADNFSVTTPVANSGAIAVPNTTSTDIKFENINSGSLGDVSNGLEIEIQIAVGAVTAKNVSFGEFRLNLGAKTSPFQPKPIQVETAACERYYVNLSTSPNVYTGIAPVFVGASQSWAIVPTPVTMRAAPAIYTSALNTRYGGADYGWGSPTVRGVVANGVDITGTSSGTGNGNSGTLSSSTGSLQFDAEL